MHTNYSSRKKGMEQALGIVITIVVLIIVGLAVTMFAVGGTNKAKTDSESQIGASGCELSKQSYCLSCVPDPTTKKCNPKPYGQLPGCIDKGIGDYRCP